MKLWDFLTLTLIESHSEDFKEYHHPVIHQSQRDVLFTQEMHSFHMNSMVKKAKTNEDKCLGL